LHLVSRELDTGLARRGYQAELDALEIWMQIARHDAAAADRLIDRFTSVIAQLAAQPHLGPPVDYLLPGLRSIPVGNYLIFHRPEDDGVFVVRIIHGAWGLTPELFEYELHARTKKPP